MRILGEKGMLGQVVARRWVELGDPGAYLVNCIRPDDLALTMGLSALERVIQPSTDAIAEDTGYARTKRALEAIPDTVTIRAGIIDITRQPPIAYRNWTLNAITPLEWADFAYQHRDEPGVHVTGREPFTRYELAELVAAIWDTPRPVGAYHPEPLDRTQERGDWPPLRDALLKYHRWLRS